MVPLLLIYFIKNIPVRRYRYVLNWTKIQEPYPSSLYLDPQNTVFVGSSGRYPVLYRHWYLFRCLRGGGWCTGHGEEGGLSSRPVVWHPAPPTTTPGRDMAAVSSPTRADADIDYPSLMQPEANSVSPVNMDSNPAPNFGLCATDSVSSEGRVSVALDESINNQHVIGHTIRFVQYFL